MRLRTTIRRGERLAELLPELVVTGLRWGSPAVAGAPRATALLEEIGSLRDVRAVPYLLWLLSVTDSVVVEAAIRTLDGLMPRDASRLLLLERTVRAAGPSLWDSPWPSDRPSPDRVIPSSRARLLIERGLPLSVLGLVSLNADGRTRELATRSLAEHKDGDELPFLLLRANDWVPQIADCARRALFNRCEASFAPRFAAALLLVERLSAQRRVDHRELVDAIRRTLTETAQGVQSLIANLGDGNERPLRRATARLVRAAVHFPLAAFASMLNDRDSVVRTDLAAASLQRDRGGDFAARIGACFADPSPRIRMLAFAAAEKDAPGVLEAHLPELLLDPNAWLREFARRKMANRTKADFARIYKSVLLQQPHRSLRAALAGLGEVGSAEDADVALAYVDRGSSPTRQIALRSVCALLGERAAATAVAALANDCVGLSRTATELIVARTVRVLPSDLPGLVSSEHHHVRANTLTALASLDRWEALIAALRGIHDTEPRVVRAAQRILARWERIPVNLYTGPNADQRRRILSALELAGESGLADVKRTVSAILERE